MSGGSGTDLASRYGRTRTFRRRNLIIAIGFAAAILIVFAAWAIWGGLFVPGAQVDVDSTGNLAVSANQIELKYQVSADPGTRVSCAVQAQDKNFGIVGWKIVALPASDQPSRALDTVIRTISPAVSASVYGCWAR